MFPQNDFITSYFAALILACTQRALKATWEGRNVKPQRPNNGQPRKWSQRKHSFCAKIGDSDAVKAGHLLISFAFDICTNKIFKELNVNMNNKC